MKRKIFFALATILGLFYTVKFCKYVYHLRDYNKQLVKAFAEADISQHHPVKCKQNAPGNVWLVSYADGDKYIANQNGLFASSINKCIDSMKIYHKKHIDPAYWEDHKFILSQKRGAGYWMWKPYLILKTLKEIPENDIIIYMDAGSTIIRPIDSLVDNLNPKDIVLFDVDFSNKQYTRRMLFQMMDMDNETAWSAKQIQANILLLRNTKTARDFITEWLYWAEKPEAITDEPKIDEYPEFSDHRHDQSILSLLAIKHKNDINILPGHVMTGYFFTHRRNGYNERSLVFPNAELSSFEFWLSKAAYRALNSG